ncbi:uncharacterized protein MELLADRAFT_105555 [Melampsora larici-populina 98AG31]|uniref:Uncharacterized protein n=2 Tax=Melampsora larici-populina (strain 98AG31 / pathotype 3-4-7) TaxID=747676 RepID=F4RIL8_MELLP|nr:uncharacterized protein MELLADRAFT_105555 [Melampsora larici-populina 98AG31]EGG07587.1 hypothetical protein MELLADRAFT_105555 [Melampsora larici-populina 98AG31]
MPTMKGIPSRLKLLSYFGLSCAALGILCIMMPILTTPLVPQMALWRGLLKYNDHIHVDVLAGFWGVCTYEHITSYDSDYKSPIDVKTKCTSSKPAYSFHLSDTIPDAKGDLNVTQTLFFFWYPLAAMLTAVSICLSLSSNFEIWRYASICALTSGLMSLGAFAATMVIFLQLTSELMKSQTSRLLPIKGEILIETYLPLIGSILIIISSIFFFNKFLEGLRDYRRSDQDEFLSGHNRTYWSQFLRRKSGSHKGKEEIEDKGKEEIKDKGKGKVEEEVQSESGQSNLPPPPPLQDDPTPKKKKRKSVSKAS